MTGSTSRRNKARVAAARFDPRVLLAPALVLAFAFLLGLPGLFQG